jgi:hypothetical protein
VPSKLAAQVWLPPALIATAVDVAAFIAVTGTELLVVELLPS